MARKRGGDDHGGGGGGHDGGGSMRWLLTYSDLITLLMAFFVIMYAMSSVDQQKFAALAGSLSIAFHQGGGTLVPMPGAGNGFGGFGNALEEAGEELAAEVADLAETGQIRVFENERGVIISLQGTVLFETGSADIRPESRQVLDIVADKLKGLTNYVQVEGYTDDRPINSIVFPTNWELSTRRASNVVRFFVEEKGLAPERFAAAGYGEFRPLYDNQTEGGRAKNRRVDIIILRSAPILNMGKELKGNAPIPIPPEATH